MSDAGLRTADFDYVLPPELIAQTPREPRDASRLLVIPRDGAPTAHRQVSDLPALLRPGDLLVLNDTRVLPARLYGRREPGGGKVEALLLRRQPDGLWEALVQPGRRMLEGARVRFGEGAAEVWGEVVERTPAGGRLLRFSDEAALMALGETPLPPYIHERLSDPERYQTVFSRNVGSAAAPTAGLHFTPELLARLQEMGVETATVTLHIGLDTFRPVKDDDPTHHPIHREAFTLPPETAERLLATRAAGGRIVAVGTTATRVLEQAALLAEQQDGEGPWIAAASGWANIFILPGHRFRAVDALLTNFHLPRSTLLMLVSAFAGRERVLDAYAEAVGERYRFFSFGDACLFV
ncbi:MAG: tRNA preQ1(34) S-adenosylmethionine ribosyltransferase-isomerase QueA [Chloroflexi bacterium]|nr:tRNA preQ1(34) S-adenosylmethionine ribosyltransferase-isomerase QueA [Chloroflexota bacterium]